MRSTTKGLLIAAAALVVFGLIVIAGTMYFLHGDLSSLNTEHYETKTYDVKGDLIKSISIQLRTRFSLNPPATEAAGWSAMNRSRRCTR